MAALCGGGCAAASAARCGRRWWRSRGRPRSRCPMRSGGCGSWTGWRAAASRRHLCDPAGGAACRARSTARRWRRRCAIWSSGTRACARCSRSGSGCRGRRSWRRRRRGRGLRSSAVDEAGLAAALTAAAGRGFDLSRRAAAAGASVCARRASEHVLLLVLHHIAGDGWSLGPLSRDLAAFYRARRDGRGGGACRRCRCNMPTTRCGSRRCWARRTMPTSAMARQLAFWTASAGGPAGADRAAGRPAAAGGGEPSRRAGARCALGAELHRGLAALARGSGASLFMVLQAGLAALLTRLGAGTDIAIGSPIAGRTDAALDDLVGFFVNTLVLRTDTVGQPELRASWSGGCGRQPCGLWRMPELPFERLVEVLNPARSLSRHPLFQVMLAFEAERGGGGARAAGACGAAAAGRDREREVRPVGGADRAARGRRRSRPGIEGVLEYASDLFDAASVEALGAAAGAAAGGGGGGRRTARSGALTILDAAERDTILRAGTTPRSWRTAHAAGAARPATLPAAVCRAGGAHAGRGRGGVRGPRAELRRARRPRQPPGASSAGPRRRARDAWSGCCVERSPEMVVGLLGILKAGGAYLPLDPDYPRERLAFMLADAGCAGAGDAAARCSSGCRRCAAAARPPHRAARRRLAGDRAAARHRAAARPRSAPPRLRHLHLGLNRNPKGRRRRASQIVLQMQRARTIYC